MNVKQVIEGIVKREYTINDIAELYGVSDRTVQSKIKKLGYVWNAKEKYYAYNGKENEKELWSIDFGTLLGAKKQKLLEESISEREDVIDLLLKSNGAKDKVYRGYYIDSDVLAVIERAGSGNKSELVNECLRKVFREKGLL